MRIKLLVPLFFVGLAATFTHAASLPTGKLIELHSCEVYAGGCTVSSESPSDSRYLLQVWDLAAGSWHGVDLAGLKAAVLETSTENLAAPGAQPEAAVIYLPDSATTAQCDALQSWLKSRDSHLSAAHVTVRKAPITVAQTAAGVFARVGSVASLEAASLGGCANRSCGESLWYGPSVPTTRFTVALNRSSTVDEPALSLKWADTNRRSVFLAQFGNGAPDKNSFVNTADWCGAGGKLF